MQKKPIVGSELKPQLRRFCAYGFLKNLQFFEPVLVLVFLDKGLSFTQIGLLMSFRAISVNAMEVPSGAVADTWGRRKTMMLSMLAYMLSFLLFAMAERYALFFPAIFCFSIGEAFRTGTHKAMIFSWLTKHGLADRKTAVYGLTRSWSKQGSSLNCLIAAAILISFQDYRWVFLLALIPYSLNLVNLYRYPLYLDEASGAQKSIKGNISVLLSGFKIIFSRRALSGLIAENICFEGAFSVIKDYLQPLLKGAALSAPVLLSASGHTRTAVLVAVVYFALNQASSAASRLSNRAASLAGSERKLAFMTWITVLVLYGAMLVGFRLNVTSICILAFVCLHTLLNIWKPVFVSRFHDNADIASAATTLSISNQSKTLAVAIAAPILGAVIDRITPAGISSATHFWPVAALGLAAAVLGILISTAQRPD